MKGKLFVLLVIAAAIAATGAGWKWHPHHGPQASAPYEIAGWTWGDRAVSNESTPLPAELTNEEHH